MARSASADLGEQLRERREALGLSIREVARRAQLSNAYISNLEHGIGNVPSEASLVRIAEVLEVDNETLNTWLFMIGRFNTEALARILGYPDVMARLRGITGLNNSRIRTLTRELVERERGKSWADRT